MDFVPDPLHLRSMPDPTVSWARIGDLDPTMKDVEDHFVALGPDGQTIGIVLRVEHGSETGQWMWSMTRMHPGPPLNVPSSGMTETRGEAARDLVECWHAFRRYYGIEDPEI